MPGDDEDDGDGDCGIWRGSFLSLQLHDANKRATNNQVLVRILSSIDFHFHLSLFLSLSNSISISPRNQNFPRSDSFLVLKFFTNNHQSKFDAQNGVQYKSSYAFMTSFHFSLFLFLSHPLDFCVHTSTSVI